MKLQLPKAVLPPTSTFHPPKAGPAEFTVRPALAGDHAVFGTRPLCSVSPSDTLSRGVRGRTPESLAGPMPVDRGIFDAHVTAANDAATPYARFDHLWKAFNVYYECCATTGGSNREIDLIGRAIRAIPQHAYSQILASDLLAPILDLDVIFDEKIWRRSQIKDSSKHGAARNRLLQLRGMPTPEDIEAMVNVLYVVRCNLAHGFKTPNAPRDREVLEATAPSVSSRPGQVTASRIARRRLTRRCSWRARVELRF